MFKYAFITYHDCIFLISRGRMVIHRGVHGFTRIPVYLACSTNNGANTVLHTFLKATREYGLPSRVQSGGENTAVSLYMLQHPLRDQKGEA